MQPLSAHPVVTRWRRAGVVLALAGLALVAGIVTMLGFGSVAQHLRADIVDAPGLIGAGALTAGSAIVAMSSLRIAMCAARLGRCQARRARRRTGSAAGHGPAGHTAAVLLGLALIPAPARAEDSATATYDVVALATPPAAHAWAVPDDVDVPDPRWRPVAPVSPAPEIGLLGNQRPARDDAHVVVRRGDCLWDLVARHLGDDASAARIAAEWPRWYAANRTVIGADPDFVTPGLVLTIPV